ncbi:MAG: cobalt transporter [Oscillatoriales cyanobacterium]|nr:MAG: cobalt transporter [Oscillatoriales cyanobacterium]
MHIPDGFLSPPVAIATGIASAAFIAVALNRTRASLGLRQAPVMGLTTAFVFAAQMINFPVAGGTSGHLLGGALASVVLGSPWAATLAMSTVFIIQSVLFADGGITALGANIFNMGLVGIWVGWWLLQPLQASICVAIELAISGTVELNIALPAMVGIHILIGIGEGLITGGLFASSWPDGLEAVAEQYGFKDKEAVAIEIPTPLAGYGVKGLEEQPIGTSIAGVLGSGICFGTAFGIAQLVKSKDA